MQLAAFPRVETLIVPVQNQSLVYFSTHAKKLTEYTAEFRSQESRVRSKTAFISGA